MNDKNIIAIIQTCGESKEIPVTDITNFCGKPLIAWSILQAKNSKTVSEVYVISDSEKTLSIAEQYGVIGIGLPNSPGTDPASSELAILHTLDQIENKNIDLIVFLKETSPLREPEDIDEAVNELIDQKADSLFSCSPVKEASLWVKEEAGWNRIIHNFKDKIPTQRMETIVQENGSICVFKPWVIDKYKNRLGGKIAIYEMPEWKFHKINSAEDMDICKWYMERHILQKELIKVKQIELIVYDFDGVMTDNRVLVTQEGGEAVYCNRSDGLGASMLKGMGLSQMILSTESNVVVKTRASKLNLPVMHGVKDKNKILQSYCKENSICLDKVLYVGNDINDLEVMKLVGYPVCPADANLAIRKISKIKLKSRGGEGVLRELAELIKP